MLRTIIFKTTLGLYFIVWTPFLFLSLISKKICRMAVLAETRGVLYLANKIGGIKYQIHYPPREENGIPTKPDANVRLDGKAIIASKHMSILEVAILVLNIPNSFFIVKRELIWIPVYGWAFFRIGLLPVNRKRGQTNMRKLSERVANKIMNGQNLVIFPEGTRVKPGVRPALRRGLLYLAHELKLPILPIGVDTGLYWPKRGLIKPGTANVYFENLLPSTANLEEIANAINRHSA
ncbi:MAG: 1-acyl-sn-glycerol-3-phosphate acyltransferase [Alphaproteobacteria bacterium]|nr:1-acyl-sn-glycerol-3-phosphate acyltransferase [Alphaproteobacteria bacterium]